MSERLSPTITVTGADERTPIAELVRLTELSPRVEIGLLYTETPEGRNRYPRRDWLQEAALALGRRCAVHLCGGGARQAISGPWVWLQQVGRIQVNGGITPDSLRRAAKWYHRLITQHNTRADAGLLTADIPGHALLVDASGGRGIGPQEWRRPETSKPVGFAGGLGPDNLATELPRIAAVAQGPWWVDMEGKLRDAEDWFSVARAEAAIEAFLAWIATGTL